MGRERPRRELKLQAACLQALKTYALAWGGAMIHSL